MRVKNKIIIALMICITVVLSACNAELKEELALTQNELYENKELLEQIANELDITKEELLVETDRANRLNESLNEANLMIADLKNNEYKLVYIGDFELTHYCPGYHGEPCGTGDGITATGTKVTAGRTIAVDPKVIPYRSKVYIEGYGWRVAEDCGGAVKGNHIDIAMNSHEEAINMGTKTGGVWLLIKK